MTEVGGMMSENIRWTGMRSGALLLALSVLLAAGCGPRGPVVVPVSGKVTINGQPLASGIEGFIQVVPENGRPAMGAIDPQTGAFQLTTTKPGDGCVTGTHKVVIIMQQMVGQESVSLVPDKYRDLTETDLQVTVDGPTDALMIQLAGPLKEASPNATPISDDPNKY
jgi:predicted small lipoprotein YifL